ncbi:hypothetical protein [Pseudomonas asiatica]|uniref:hypothetical protein n=1 Tax=Pseudomonas asiatica TaxID=2219225 RepID=UPI001E5DDF2F|nr:hypothetical protein [Pseudomonas asiatica]MCE0943045.1 hypothetical protein [Pseudomonas asiatica]MCE1063846.1 hypothetical protein [Pseudomonas asiatica]
MNLRIAEIDAKLLMDAGTFMNVVADLVNDNATEEDSEGSPFLNGYRLAGLMNGLRLVAHSLCERSENLSEFIWKEEEKAQAALHRRKGQDTARECDIGGKSGTRCAA